MKFNKRMYDGEYFKHWDGRSNRVFYVEDLLADHICPPPYASQGAVETLETKVYQLSKVVAYLLEKLPAEEVAKLFALSSNCMELVLIKEE